MGSMDYESMTVAQLKETLRAEGLPVSGRKADLVARLVSQHAPEAAPPSSAAPPLSSSATSAATSSVAIPMGTIEVQCASCNQLLTLPVSHKGRFQCPTCGAEQEMGSTAPAKDPMQDLSDRYASARSTAHRLNVAGIVVGILAILVFFAGLGQLGPDPENCQEIEYEGEMAMSCHGGGFVENPEALNYVGVSCLLLVPLAIALPVIGQAVRPPPLITQQASYGANGAPSGEPTEQVIEWDSPVQRLVGAVSLLFGGSLVAATVLLALAVLAVFILALMALGSLG
ncbi:MAG: hypothetical protein CMA08_01680 [Euryarchaeota archaeon]|nr:hypothetical protein [Euryarchaeota archaeon]OUX22746.1 MAG: hypothetical protein CBE12_01345 [Euryarchaeota archaeon TMED252]